MSEHIDQDDLEVFMLWQDDPFEFIEAMWGLRPLKRGDLFRKGKHLTWQQTKIVKAVKDGENRISVASGHGIGKTAVLSMLIIWFLYTKKDAQVPCTANTGDQLYDILWKEIKVWLNKMPEGHSEKFDHQTQYVRFKESPDTWFARAKTAKKENPEALAGVHGDHVMMVVDEASGVPDEVYETAEGALTNEDVLVIMISNPTRASGYFYDSHHADSDYWCTFQFSSENSPIVKDEFKERIIDKYGKDSREYRVRVKGKFPSSEGIDDKGFMPLLKPRDIAIISTGRFNGMRAMGVDPAGSGSDYAVWVIRDNFIAKRVGRSETDNPKTIASKTMTLMQEYDVQDKMVTVDNFGVGANVAQHMALAGYNVNAVNAGMDPMDDRFLNLRAELFWDVRKWLRSGGDLVRCGDWDELKNIKYRQELDSKIKVKSKRLMMKDDNVSSPDTADALKLTFYKDIERARKLENAQWRRKKKFGSENGKKKHDDSYSRRMA